MAKIMFISNRQGLVWGEGSNLLGEKICNSCTMFVYKLCYIIIRDFCPIYPRVYVVSSLFIYLFI
jgi:hypothetical protein